MKLFLSSENVCPDLVSAFIEFVGKPLHEVKFALIENAADTYPEEKKTWMYAARKNLQNLGMHIALVDLREYKEKPTELKELLGNFDMIWIGGGNVFYLRWLLKATGLDTFLKELLEQGILYGGESAGSIVVGPSLESYDKADKPEDAPEVMYEGLGLTNIFIIPHWNVEKYQTILQEIKEHYEKLRKTTICITNQQAVIVEDNEWKIVPEKKLEKKN